MKGSSSTHCSPITAIQETYSALYFPLSPTFSTHRIVYIHTRLRAAARGCALFSLLSFLLSTLKNMRGYDQHYERDFLQDLYSSADLLCLGVLALFIIKLHECKLALKKAYSAALSPTHTIWTDPKTRISMIGEIVLVALAVPPMYNPVISFRTIGIQRELSLDDVMYHWCLVRLYHVLRFFYLESEFCSEKALFRLSVVKLEPSVWFYVKYLALRRYIVYSFAVIVVLIVLSALVLIVFERSLPDSQFVSPTTAFYCSGITMATIGYGDVLASTFLGRAVLVLVAILGNYAQAILTLGVYNTSLFTPVERGLAAEMYKRRFKEKELRSAAGAYLQRWWRLRFLRKHRAGNRFLQLQLLRKAKIRFQKELLKASYGAGLVFSQSIRHFDREISRELTLTKQKLSINAEIFRFSAQLRDFNLKLSRDLNSIRRKTAKFSVLTNSAASSRRSSIVLSIPRLSCSFNVPQRRKHVESTGLRTHRARRRVLARKTERLMSESSSVDM